MLQRVYPAGYVFLDLSGTAPAAVGTVYFYLNTTTTLATIYSDLVGTVSANPLTLGADGRLPNDVYVNSKVRVRLREYHVTPASGTLVFTKDNQPNVYENPYYASNYGCVLDGSTADDAAFALAVTAAANRTLIIDGPIKFDDNVTVPVTVHIIAQGTITSATGKYFMAYKITHELEGWTSGFDDNYDMRAFGGYPSLGSTIDSTLALNRAFTYIRTGIAGGGHATLWFKPRRDISGNAIWWFNTLPNDLDFHCNIRGTREATLYRNFQAANIRQGIFNLRPGANGELSGFGIVGIAAGCQTAGVGTGSAINIVSSASQSVSFIRLVDLTITTDSTNAFDWTLNMDGSDNTSGAPGLRANFITDCQIFGAQSGAVRLYGVNGLSAKFTGIAAAGGTSGKLLIDGTAGVNSGSNFISSAATSNVELGYCYLSALTIGNLGGTLVNTANTVTTTLLTGYVSGAITNLSPSFRLIQSNVITTRTDAGAVDLTSSTVWIVTVGGPKAITLADGYEGQEMTLIMKTDGGDATLTPASFFGNPSATIVFDDVGDTARLLFTNAAWHWLGGSATVA